MNSIDKAYLEILNENKVYFGYRVNEQTFKPFEYHNVFCCASILNKDIDHVLKRLFERSKYTLNDIFIILKRGVDKFLELSKTKYKDRKKKSFHIISKEYKDIKLVVEIVKNFQKDPFKVLEEPNEIFYKCNYVCFLYTVLEADMEKHPMDDELFVENKEQDETKFSILYVD